MILIQTNKLTAIIALLWIVFVATSGASAAEIAFYVAPDGSDYSQGTSIDKPFASIQKARDAIRTLKKEEGLDNPVTVYIRGGRYELRETLVFSLEDSGTESCPITYTAYNDEEVIISGAKTISGPWKDFTGTIKVCTIEEAKNGKWRFRQLFVEDERQTRARMPNEGYYWTEDPDGERIFKYKNNEFSDWKHLTDVEVVIFYSWNESRFLLESINEQNKTVTFTGTMHRRFGSRGENRYYIENVLEGLDQPGEWYLDHHSGELYYWPPDEMSLSNLRAPVITELIRFEGDIDNDQYVQNIRLTGLTLCDTDWTLPDEGITQIRDVGDIWFPSAITLKGTKNCALEDNVIRNTGTYAVDITGDGNQITGNEIYDTGSGGVITRSYGRERNVISYNHIHHCGKVFHSAVGVNIDDGGGLIAHNLIHDITHSGVYGRHWSTDYGQEQERRNQDQGLIIEYNEIYDVVQIINDGAGIFVRDSDIILRNNLIHDVYSYEDPKKIERYNVGGTPGWGIYLGCETRNTLVENNIIYNAREGLQVWHHNRNNTIANNIFANCDYRMIRYNNSRNLKHENIRFLRNIVYYQDPKIDLFYTRRGMDSAPVESDFNVLFCRKKGEMLITGMEGVESFEEWQKQLGYDEHSIVADPLFVDPDNNNFSLKPNSPAFKLGFKPIDMTTVGIRGRKK